MIEFVFSSPLHFGLVSMGMAASPFAMGVVALVGARIDGYGWGTTDMTAETGVALAGVLVLLLPLLLACFTAFDRLVRFEYAGHQHGDHCLAMARQSTGLT